MEGKSFVLDFSNSFPLRETIGNEEDQESDGKFITALTICLEKIQAA